MLFIVNPTAGKDRAKNIIPIIEDFMDERRIGYRIIKTTRPKEATEIAKEVLQKGAEVVVAVGGDGTVNEVTEGIISTGKGILGIIPGGTGNDLARTLNIPMEPIEALKLLVDCSPVHIDIGRVNNHFFLNVASIGFDSEIVKNTEKIKKYVSGKIAYTIGVLRTLLSYKMKKVKISLDDRSFDLDILLLAIGNGKYYGGGMKICPMAEINDGYFHVCAIKKISKPFLLIIFPSVFMGKHVRFKKYVSFYKTKKIEIVTKDQVYLNIDGEITEPKETLAFKMESHSIRIIAHL